MYSPMLYAIVDDVREAFKSYVANVLNGQILELQAHLDLIPD